MNFKTLGQICRDFRIANNITIVSIAEMSNYSKWNVYKFEQGRLTNLNIFLVYLALGLDIDRRILWQVLKTF